MNLLRTLLLLFFLFNSAVLCASEHPFLICRRDQFAELQGRTARSPWLEMKARALKTFNTVSYDPAAILDYKELQMIELTGSLALLYIIDPMNRGVYRSKLLDTLNQWPDLFASVQSGTPTDYLPRVYTSSAFFSSVLALDVIHDDLTAAQLAKIETALGQVAEWYWSYLSPWQLADIGVRALWATYQNDTARMSDALTGYHAAVMEQLNEEGGFGEGPLYAWSRLAGDRERIPKWGFMYVAEFTGLDATYFSDPKLKTFYEWLFNGAVTPFGWNPTFGDTSNAAERGGNYYDGTTGPYYNLVITETTVSLFSAKAAAWSSRLVGLATKPLRFPGDLITYCATPGGIPPAAAPASAVWPRTMAAFWENNSTTDALMGILWNAETSREGHKHKEVNAIYLAGYGEALLVNAGLGDSTKLGAGGFSWEYLHDTAVSGNTVLVNGEDHVSKDGDGFAESLISTQFDYASALSKTALGGRAGHYRNFVFIHPQDGKNGYFVLLDEVSTPNAGDRVNIALHPYSAAVKTVAPEKEYAWTIAKRLTTPTVLTIFLGTPPVAGGVSLPNGVLAGGGDLVGKYLYGTYAVDAAKNAAVVTVLYPSNAAHPKSVFQRRVLTGASGASIDNGGGNVDYALASSGKTDVSIAGASFRGKGGIFRKIGAGVPFFFVRQGTSFNDGGVQRFGFSSVAPVSLHLRGREGKIVSPGTDVTFYSPRVIGVTVDDVGAVSKPAGLGGVTVTLAAGPHSIKLEGPPVPSSTVNLSNPLASVVVYPNPWRVDQHTGPVTFRSLTAGSTVKIFNIAGHHVRTLPATATSAQWDLENESGDRVASGLYVYRITDNQGGKAQGRLVVIR